MSIDEIMMKWFDETDTLIRNKIDNFSSIDGLCQTVLHSARDYCCAVSFLLQGEHVMPAQALLRCLCELSMKLFWCLRVPDGTNDKDAETVVKQKICRWEKDTLCRNVKILEEFQDAADRSVGQEIGKAMEDLKRVPLFSDKTVKQLPPFKDLVGQLPSLFRSEVYPLLYLRFNSAVHPDVTSLVDNYIAKNSGQSGFDPTTLIPYCLAHAFHINGAIRRNYKINISDIKQEYQAVMKTLT